MGEMKGIVVQQRLAVIIQKHPGNPECPHVGSALVDVWSSGNDAVEIPGKSLRRHDSLVAAG